MSDHPYRLPALSLEASRSAYEAAKDLAERAHRDYVDARRCHRAIWAPRIFASLVGLGVALGMASTWRACADIVARPTPCVEKVTELGALVSEVQCGEGASIRTEGHIVHCVCPHDGGAP